MSRAEVLELACDADRRAIALCLWNEADARFICPTIGDMEEIREECNKCVECQLIKQNQNMTS
jgi:hypothetical protein